MRLKLKKILILLTKIVLLFLILFIVLNYAFPLKKDLEYSKTIEDAEGTILYSFLTPDDKWRLYTELDEISPALKKAIIFKEDKYFYYHFGINPIAITRAFWNNISQQKRTSGASTITMQVARLLYPKPRTYANKLKEIFRAFQLEWCYSKAEILQLYLNLVPYGSNIEGVKSAALLYLQKQPNHLSLAEITTLSIIPNRPTSLLPGKNNLLITQERNKWLKRFKKHKLFEDKTINDALQENFAAKRHPTPKFAPHFSYRMKQKFPNEINIKTNLNLAFQQSIQEIAKNFARTYKGQNINNISILVLENESKNVVAYLGSQDFFDDSNAGQVDGVNAIRQPGSTLKPLLYGMAIDQGLVTPKSIITDVPINYDGYAPVNYDKNYNGYVSIEKALALSLNVPAVKILNQLGVKPFVEKLSACQFESILRKKDLLGLSVVLGGCGTTLQELTTLYSAFANNGKFENINWLKDQTKQKTDSLYTVLSPFSNFMVSEMMTNLERPDLPSAWRNTKNLPQLAWKTGTSYGRKDAWAIGFNHKYTVGVWVGNFSGDGVPEMTGAQHATPILFNVFKSIDKEHSKSWLKKPKDLDIRYICTKSGNLATERCTDKAFDYYIPLVSSNQSCQHLSKVYLSANDSVSYCINCRPNTGYKTKWLPNHPPEILAYFEHEHIGYEKIPAHNPNCEFWQKDQAPKIISPNDGSTYYIDKDYPEEIMLSCHASKDASKIFWYINDVFYIESTKNEAIFFMPKAGKTKISCSDDLGGNTNVWIHVDFVSL